MNKDTYLLNFSKKNLQIFYIMDEITNLVKDLITQTENSTQQRLR